MLNRFDRYYNYLNKDKGICSPSLQATILCVAESIQELVGVLNKSKTTEENT